jgi:hypothetical protein
VKLESFNILAFHSLYCSRYPSHDYWVCWENCWHVQVGLWSPFIEGLVTYSYIL